MAGSDFEETKDERVRISDDSNYSDDPSFSELDTNDRSLQPRQPPKKIITMAAKAKPTQQQDVQAMSMSMQGEAEASELQCGTCRKIFPRERNLLAHREDRLRPCQPPEKRAEARRQQLQKARAKYQRSDKGKAKAEVYAASSQRKQAHKEYNQRRKDDDA